MRKLLFALVAVAAVAPLAAFGTASAAPAHPAAAARAEIPEACSGAQPGNEWGGLGTTGSLSAGTELYVAASGETMATSTWCQDLDGVPANYELLRMKGTSECAQYEGGPGGGVKTWVELAACDSHKFAQLWYTHNIDDGAHQIVYNDYAGAGACLTSDNPNNSIGDTPAFLVPVSGGCGNGQGGQIWKDFPETS